MAERTCSVDGCGYPSHRIGLCAAHRERLRAHGDVLAHVPVRRKAAGTLEQRFRAYFTEGDPDECWLWTGGVNSAGYPRIADPGGKRYLLATRLALSLHLGEPLPDHVEACHHCDTPLCVNPHHLFAGSHTDNMRDMVRKGRGWWQRLAPHAPPGTSTRPGAE